MTLIYVPISIGELIDKITILTLKVQRLTAESSMNAAKELSELEKIYIKNNFNIDKSLIDELASINSRLWDIENQLRMKELKQDFGQEFITLARSVYFENDKRFKVKKEINLLSGSIIVEQKSYQKY